MTTMFFTKQEVYKKQVMKDSLIDFSKFCFVDHDKTPKSRWIRDAQNDKCNEAIGNLYLLLSEYKK